MRIILFTGKGGVGKTTVAAATALRCAQLGYKTMVMSTDIAHSLGDSFEVEIGKEATLISGNLWAQEIDVNEEIKKNWGTIEVFMKDFLIYQGFGNVMAEELAIFPGMEDVFSLLKIMTYYVEGSFEVIIVDCAPTGDTLRLLAIPDIAKWYMEKIFKLERIAMKVIRPMAQHFVKMPLPGDDLYEAMAKLYHNLILMKGLLVDKEMTTMRMVLNPEKMIIKESQRAYTFLNLFGYSMDGVIVNRILPEEIEDVYYQKWKEIQKIHLKEIQDSFQPLPIFIAKLWDQEITGIELLSQMAEDIYQEENPSQVFYREKPIEIEELNGDFYLLLQLPFTTRQELEMWIKGEELVLKFRNFKRNIFLPRALISLKLKEAKLEGKTLKIKFGG